MSYDGLRNREKKSYGAASSRVIRIVSTEELNSLASLNCNSYTCGWARRWKKSTGILCLKSCCEVLYFGGFLISNGEDCDVSGINMYEYAMVSCYYVNYDRNSRIKSVSKSDRSYTYCVLQNEEVVCLFAGQ